MSKARDLANIAGSNAFTAADETKLDGIETSADVTDADNVDPLVDAHLNSSTATSGEYLSWNGTDYDWASVPAGYADSDVDTHLNTSGATNGQYLGWNGTDYAWSTVDLSTKLDLSGGTMTGDINHGDSVKAQFGADNDLQIYHNGSGSFIDDAGTGNMHIRASNAFWLQNAGGTATMLYAQDGDKVRLYHNNSARLDTTSTGIDVTGTINADGLSGITSVDSTTATAIGNAGVGGGATYSSTAPSNPSNGDFWINTSTNDGYLKVYSFGAWKDIEWVGQGNTYSGGHLYTQATAGSTSTYTFTVPSGVKSISAVCIGQGATGTNWETVGGNGGGALAYKNSITVSAGDTFTITISNTATTFYKAGVVNLIANAGSGRNGGTYSGADGGGNGGDGGVNNYSQGPYYAGTGSGGAGGYSGAGGTGGTLSSLTGTTGGAGSGGGAGAGGGAYDSGYNSGYAGGSAGGGTCPYGEGTSGAGGTGDTNSGTGSNATAGGHGSIDVTVPSSTSINTIAFGAGNNAGYAGASIASRGTRRGACRIVWGIGNNQSFPTTNVGYRDGNAAGTTIEGYN